MRFAVSLIAYYIEMLIAVDYCCNVFEHKQNKRKMWLSAFLLYSVGFAVFSGFENIFSNLSIFVLINTLFIFSCFTAKLPRAVFISLILTSLMACSEMICILGGEVTNIGNIVAYGNNITTYTIGALVSKLVYFLLTKVISRWSFKENYGKLSRPPAFLFIFPLCAFLMFCLFWIISSLTELPGYLDIVMSVTSIFIVICIILSYFFYNKTQQTINELYNAQAQTEKVKIDIAYYSILDRQNEQLKTIIHNEKNHLATIKSLSDNTEINDYIDRLLGEIKVFSLLGNTGNKMLDLVLNKYIYMCENENITFNIIVKTANLSFIDNTDLVTIMSNMLDNAVEAARNSKEKMIELSINKTNGFDMITCINSCDIQPSYNGDVLKTTKGDDVFHGLGVKSIKKVISNYKGSYKWNYDKNAKEFVVYIAVKDK